MDAHDDTLFAKPLSSASEEVALDSALEERALDGRPWRGDEDGPMPMRSVPLRPPVPDLGRIDRSRWRAVLGSVPRGQRVDAAVAPGADLEALELALSLPPAPSELARNALVDGPSLTPSRGVNAGAARQVNVRLGPAEHQDLRTAAKLLGLTPTQVARLCIVTGVRRAIADHDAALERLKHD